ncbi:hypothetical protein SLEP1_g23923 [Rubroshorea leprosula]|uniref:DUF4220 domain-containing protein n=1 Tax=Rubroshorea leprosula TaxID=152421 RepID=A0AAV5JN89_9ROSI|nr:hypothetical protein SLEP1_g23923 [Rubroshorea leprosula]
MGCEGIAAAAGGVGEMGGADWIAIATLAKLSGSLAESTATNILRAYWAPLLLVHLGGPDTITAYAFEDNNLWIRHLVILLVKVILVIYVVCLSWTFCWLSFLTLPLILAGIIKYVEKILCLKLNNSQKTKPIISNMFNRRDHSNPDKFPALERLRRENPNILTSYLLFTITRPDVNDYLSSQNFSDVGTRFRTHLRETTGMDGIMALWVANQYIPNTRDIDVVAVFSIELAFMFDVVYTKTSLIYTKLGCFLRLTSFTSSLLVLLLFLINIINEANLHGSRIDITITGILLSGAIAQEFYAAWAMLSSDWAVLVAEFHHNVLVRNMFKVTLKCFSCLLHRSRTTSSNQMGQFDLLEYCWRYKKRNANESHGFLSKITIGSEIVEIWHKHWFTKFVDVPDLLKRPICYSGLLEGIISKNIDITRGQQALRKLRPFDKLFDKLKWSIEMDFDHSIIIWHLSTSVFYFQEDHHDDEAMKISKHVSNYMMYLLAMCPALLLSEHSKSFWLDHAYDNLKERLPRATDTSNAASALLSIPHDVQNEEPEPRGIIFQQLMKEVQDLVAFLRDEDNKWKIMRDVWMEMLSYAASSSQHINHIKQLGEGIEFLSLIWLLVSHGIIQTARGKPLHYPNCPQ